MHPAPAPSPHAPSLLAGALMTLALTSAHHVYGAVRYDTPWRHHAAVVSFWVTLALLAAFTAYRRHPGTRAGRLAGWTLAALALLFPGLVFGLFEGLYNHVLKDVLFFAGTPRALLLRLFPPPTYELPNDVWFELSGVLQVVPATFTARVLLRFAGALRREAGRGTRPAGEAPRRLA